MRSRTLSIPQLRDIRAELEREQSRLHDEDPHSHAVAAALGRLDDGTYGNCAGCENPIPFARLAAIPEAEYCIDCRMQMSARLAVPFN